MIDDIDDIDDMDQVNYISMTMRHEIQFIRGYNMSLSPVRGTLTFGLVPIDMDLDDDTDMKYEILHKLAYFLDTSFNRSIVFSHNNTHMRNMFIQGDQFALNNTITLLPFEASDNTIIMVLQSKLQALAGDNFMIDMCKFDPVDTNCIKLEFYGDASASLPSVDEWMGGALAETGIPPWWLRDDMTTMDFVCADCLAGKKHKKEKQSKKKSFSDDTPVLIKHDFRNSSLGDNHTPKKRKNTKKKSDDGSSENLDPPKD